MSGRSKLASGSRKGGGGRVGRDLSPYLSYLIIFRSKVISRAPKPPAATKCPPRHTLLKEAVVVVALLLGGLSSGMAIEGIRFVGWSRYLLVYYLSFYDFNIAIFNFLLRRKSAVLSVRTHVCSRA